MSWLLLFILASVTAALQSIQIDDTLQISSAATNIATLSDSEISFMNDSLVITASQLEVKGSLKITTPGNSYTFYAAAAGTQVSTDYMNVPSGSLVTLDDNFFPYGPGLNTLYLIADSPACNTGLGATYCGPGLYNTGFVSFSAGILIINLTGPAQSFPNLLLFPYSACISGRWGTNLTISAIRELRIRVVNSFTNTTSDIAIMNMSPSLSAQVIFSTTVGNGFSLCGIMTLDASLVPLNQAVYQVFVVAVQTTGIVERISADSLTGVWMIGQGFRVVPLFI